MPKARFKATTRWKVYDSSPKTGDPEIVNIEASTANEAVELAQKQAAARKTVQNKKYKTKK